MTTTTLRNHRYSQCTVVTADNGDITFVSYRTAVVKLTADGVAHFGPVSCTATTRKQVGWFLREYAPSLTYQLAKQLYADGLAYDIRTGEVFPDPFGV